jgi:transcriptional regulator with XRE-family HTH domain
LTAVKSAPPPTAEIIPLAAASGAVALDVAAEPGSVDSPSTARARSADRHVGARIRERRVMLGFSQQQLAELIGVTYQQAHKYEHGLNRISAGRLYEIAQALRVPISWFYEGLDSPPLPAEMSQRERACLELARNFVAIENEKFQEALSQMARALAARSRAESSEP